jgi:hypothetical protein
MERERAKEFFGMVEEPSALASKVCISFHLPPFLLFSFPSTLRFSFPRLASSFSTPHNMPLRTLQIMGIKSRTFDIPAPSTTTNGTVSGSDKSYRVKLTDKEKRRVEKLIREAKSLTEIARLEKEIAEGRIPRGEADEMEE